VPIAHKVDVGGGDDLCYEDLAGRPGAEEQTRDLPDDAAGWLFYTSGTTGRPKGAVISHRNLVFVVVSWCADLYCLRADDVVLHCAPLSHGAGFHALAAVARGAQNLVHDRFDPELVLSDIARYRVTTSWLVPTQVRMLSPPVTASSARSSLSRTSCHTRLSSSMITDPAITSAPLDSRHPGGRSFQISVAHRPSPAAEALSWDIMRRSR